MAAKAGGGGAESKRAHAPTDLEKKPAPPTDALRVRRKASPCDFAHNDMFLCFICSLRSAGLSDSAAANHASCNHPVRPLCFPISAIVLIMDVFLLF